MGRTLILTSPHEKGHDVEAFQRAMTRNGYYHGIINGEYGPLSAQAAYRSKFWLGYSKPDHVAGDRLYGYLQGAPTSVAMKLIAKRRRAAVPKLTLGQKALNEAMKYKGLKENPAGSNHTIFGIRYGFDHVPWCNEFVSACYVAVGSKAFKLGARYSYVPNMDYDARLGHNNLTIAHPGPVAGDPVTFDWDNDHVPDHTGLFVKWLNTEHTKFATIEGNTSVGNNSNGGEVMYREDRVISEVHSFIHVGA